jgi:hypothetical protein
MVAMKSTNPSPVAIRSFIMVLLSIRFLSFVTASIKRCAERKAQAPLALGPGCQSGAGL